MLRAWLHTLRDRLPVNAAADFAAQLPEFFRGVFYDGWQSNRVPDKYGAEEYRRRFAHEAQIPIECVDAAAAAVTAAMRVRLSPGHVDQAAELATLTEAARILAHGLQQPPTEEPDPMRPGQAARRAYELLIATRPDRL